MKTRIEKAVRLIAVALCAFSLSAFADEAAVTNEIVFSAKFSGPEAASRANADIPFRKDLRQAGGVAFDFMCEDVWACCRFDCYLVSKGGCYVASFSPAASGKWKRIVVNKTDVRVEGSPSGWKNVERIRISAWRAGPGGTGCRLKNLEVVSVVPRIVVVHGRSRPEDASRSAGALATMGVDSAIMAGADLDMPILSGVKAVFLPNAGDLSDEKASVLKSFVRQGGKLALAKNNREDLLAIGEVNDLVWYGIAKDGTYAAMETFVGKLVPSVRTDIAAGRRARIARREACRAELKKVRAAGADECRMFSCHRPYGIDRETGWDESIRLLKEHGFNRIDVNLAWGGAAAYPSKVLPLSDGAKAAGGRDCFRECLAACRKYGIKMTAWKVCFNLAIGRSAAFVEKLRKEGRLCATSDGKEDLWLCLSHPDNIRLEIDALVELAKMQPDGIGLDYIRHHNPRGCFCDRCRIRFERCLGRRVKAWPRDVLAGGSDADRWTAFRCGVVTDVVREASRRIRTEAPGVKISAYVYEDAEGARTDVGQDWVTWCRDGLIDDVWPMCYRESAEVLAGMLPRLRRQAGNVPCYPCLGLYLKTETADAATCAAMIGRQIDRVREAGGKGFCLFDFTAGALPALELLSEHVTRREAVDPAVYGFSPDASAATNAAALQRALDGGNRVVRISRPGRYRLDRTILVDDNTRLEGVDGAVLAKDSKYCNMLLNRGAAAGVTNVNITLKNLEVADCGYSAYPDFNTVLHGLWGQVAFLGVKNLRISGFRCTEFTAGQYCVQVVAFDGLTIEDFTIRGNKDGVHLNDGKNFVIRRGCLRTDDDGIALNAGEWPNCTPRMGSITDGVIEDIVDEAGGSCNFVRVISGVWKDWHPGMRLQRGDMFRHKGHLYTVYPAPLKNSEKATTIPPTHRLGVWKSPEGVNFLYMQPGDVMSATVSNVVIRNCRMEEPTRTVACLWEIGAYARLIHPEIPGKDYPTVDIRLEQVEKTVPGPIVSCASDAMVTFDSCRATDGTFIKMNYYPWQCTRRPIRRYSFDGHKFIRFEADNGLVRDPALSADTAHVLKFKPRGNAPLGISRFIVHSPVSTEEK